MNTLKKQFSDALKREGKEITGYYNNSVYKCLFRKNEDSNNIKSHVTIFYDNLTPIYQGQILTYGGKHFLTLNKETVENDVYFKSSLLECNLLLPVVVNQIKQFIPCYSNPMTSPTVIESNIMTRLDGNSEVITETTDILNYSLLDQTYNIFGWWYEVQNLHTMSNITHIYLQWVAQAPQIPAFELVSSMSIYEVGTTTNLGALPTINDVVDETATITYATSDPLLATVDTFGVVTFIAEGTVTITATWVEKNLSDAVTLTVNAVDAPLTYYATITGDWEDNQQYLEIEHTFTATFKDNLNNPVTAIAPVFTVGNFSMTGMAAKTVLTDNGDGTGKLKFATFGDTQFVLKTFDLTCTDATLSATGTVTLTIRGLY